MSALPLALRKHAVSTLLVVLAAGLGVYLFVVDRGSVTTRESELRKRNLLPAYRRDDISLIEIDRPSDSLRIVRHLDSSGDALFQMSIAAKTAADAGATASAPEELADQSTVDKLMSAIEFATPERRLGPNGGVDRHAAGLDNPRLRVTVVMGKLTYRLAVGQAAPAPGAATYGETEGERGGEYPGRVVL